MNQSPAEDAAARPPMPTSVRVAVIAMGVLAALLLSGAALLWYSYDAAVDRVVSQSELTRDEAQQFVQMSLLPDLVLGLMLAAAALFLPRRQPWARWMGLAAGALLVLLALLQSVGAGGVTVSSLLLLVLSIASVTSLLARTTAAWVPRLRATA